MSDNPKLIQALKEGKTPFETMPMGCLKGDAIVHKHGADKYGRFNWRVDKIKYSTYKAAILRHLLAVFEDLQDIDPDSGVHHFHHIRAGCAIVLDAIEHGTLIDDRTDNESKAAAQEKIRMG